MKDEEENQDKVLKFYTSIMDSLHFYLHHLFDVGLRVRSNLLENEEDKSKESEFKRVCAAVKAGREVTKSFDKFQSQAKFNFSISQTGAIPCNLPGFYRFFIYMITINSVRSVFRGIVNYVEG